MQDTKIKLVCPGKMTVELYERGLRVLQQTLDAQGTSELDKLMYIFEHSQLKEASLCDLADHSPEAKAIVDHYISVYFPE